MRVATDFPGVDGPGISHGISTYCSLRRPLDEHFTGAIRIWKRCGTTSGRDRIVKVISLSIKTPTGKFDILNFIGSDPISKIFDDYSSRSGIPKCQVKLFFFGQEIVKDGMTLHESGLRDGTVLTMVPELRGGKPVIYLYPPTAVDVSVKLSLVPAWEYSAIYPLAVIKKVELAKGQVGQQIEWNVHANPSGLLQDKVSEKDISYLFWEAECAGCLALLFLTDDPFSGHVRILLRHPLLLLPPVPTPQPLTLTLPSVVHSTQRHLKSLRIIASSFRLIRYHPTLMMLWPCSVYTLKPGRLSLRESSSLALCARLLIIAIYLVTGYLPS